MNAVGEQTTSLATLKRLDLGLGLGLGLCIVWGAVFFFLFFFLLAEAIILQLFIRSDGVHSLSCPALSKLFDAMPGFRDIVIEWER